MSDLVKVNNGELLTTSKVVFEYFKVSGGHRYIMAMINKLIDDEPEFSNKNFFSHLKFLSFSQPGQNLIQQALNARICSPRPALCSFPVLPRRQFH